MNTGNTQLQLSLKCKEFTR